MTLVSRVTASIRTRLKCVTGFPILAIMTNLKYSKGISYDINNEIKIMKILRNYED